MSLLARGPAVSRRAAARFSTSAARRSAHDEVYEVIIVAHDCPTY
jgi:hypothetical protein